MSFIGWLAALVALATGLAMLHDTRLDHAARRQLRTTLREGLRYVAVARVHPADVPGLVNSMRLLLRIIVLLAIVGASGVLVLLPGPAEASCSPYEVVLRCALAAFMAMQAPCPWLRFITVGEAAVAPQEDGRRVL